MLKIWISTLLVSCGVAHAAAPVVSCDKAYAAEVSRPGLLAITGQDGKFSHVKIGHHVDGGSFSQDDRYLILYGMPAQANPQSPQTNFLTLYKLGGQPKTIVRRVYGGGIYSADFSADGKFVAVTTRIGVDILDVKKISFESHDPAYTPKFPLQACDRH
ncbi:hypothetical protein PQR14_32250 [Paraburkholderia bryophila]|uniref:hypothetical protein n=1 Tax=Burkholderiaceae TaxID=119060 RepID=UPI00055792B1|nr:hypothetical protein [Burkholderia sp. 9120]